MNLGAKVGFGIQRYVRDEVRLPIALRVAIHAGFVGAVLSGHDESMCILRLNHIALLLEARTGRANGDGYGMGIVLIGQRGSG